MERKIFAFFASSRFKHSTRVAIKNPATGAGQMVSLLCLSDFQDFNIIRPAGGFHFYRFAHFAIENSFANRRLV